MTDRFMQLRKEYRLRTLDEENLHQSPFVQFETWFQEAIDAQVSHPDAMTLATTTPEGTPDARIVLLKEIRPDGFHFFTNYLSAKGRQLALNYSATLLFFWPDLERQVRIKGTVQKTSDEVSDNYFSKRPLEAQLSSIASPQSAIVPNRKWLEDEVARVRSSIGTEVTRRSSHWGGYLVMPNEFEFWQGRENRLHDRLRYRLGDDAKWSIARLAP